ncbi:MAG: GntR family transcriptional regulator [Lentisphaeria bacterium]
MTRVRPSADWNAMAVASPTLCRALKWRLAQGEILGRHLHAGNRFPAIRALAAKYGASRSTVMRAVEELVAEGVLETRRRQGMFVLDPARCKPYRRSSHFVSVIVPAARPYYQPIVRGIEETLNRHHYYLLVKSLDCTYKGFADCVREAAEVLKVAGLIVAIPKPSRTEALFAQLESLAIPVILLECEHPRFSSVTVDEQHGFAEATRHLIDLGHRELAYLGPDPREAPQRHAGFVRTLTEHGLPYLPHRNCIEPLASAGQGWSDHAYRLICDEGVTAFACYNDDYAARLVRHLAARGVKVPRDVSVTGCDNLKSLHPGGLPLTTIDPQADELGRRATAKLLRRLHCAGAAGEAALEHASLTPKLIPGRSTAPPRRD